MVERSKNLIYIPTLAFGVLAISGIPWRGSLSRRFYQPNTAISKNIAASKEIGFAIAQQNYDTTLNWMRLGPNVELHNTPDKIAQFVTWVGVLDSNRYAAAGVVVTSQDGKKEFKILISASQFKTLMSLKDVNQAAFKIDTANKVLETPGIDLRRFLEDPKYRDEIERKAQISQPGINPSNR